MGVSLICVTSCGQIALWSDGNIHKSFHYQAATLAPRCDNRLLAPVAFCTKYAPTICVCGSVTAAFCAVHTKEKLAALLESSLKQTSNTGFSNERVARLMEGKKGGKCTALCKVQPKRTQIPCAVTWQSCAQTKLSPDALGCAVSLSEQMDSQLNMKSVALNTVKVIGLELLVQPSRLKLESQGFV